MGLQPTPSPNGLRRRSLDGEAHRVGDAIAAPHGQVHGAQKLATQRSPELQAGVTLLQQGWPAAPHGRHVPLEQSWRAMHRDAPEQQGWPLAPHEAVAPQ